MNDSHVFLLVPGMCIAFLYCNYSEPHSQNRICDAYLENRLTCSLLIEASSPLALNSYKKTAHITSPHWDEFISAVPPKFLMWKMKIIFTFTIRLLTHVTSEETSYPTKSSILPVCGSRGNFDSAWTSGSFSAGELPSLSGKKNLTVHVHCLYLDMIIPK